MITILKDYATARKLKFGTSGLRALNSLLTDEVCYYYTVAFIQFLENTRQITHKKCIIAGDLRHNTMDIVRIVYQALHDLGYQIEYGGNIPTPALCNYALEMNCPGIMVTGSHIPGNMNGIKFYKPDGEILKADEQEILSQTIQPDKNLFNEEGHYLKSKIIDIPISPVAYDSFVIRCCRLFSADAFDGLKIGIYVHSSVAAAMLTDILKRLGAHVIEFGKQPSFHSIDTEAISEDDRLIAKKNLEKYKLNAVVSTDGDGDRPLITDEYGHWVHGDIIGILSSIILNAKNVITTYTCNHSLEKIAQLEHVYRTKIGSPYIVAKINELIQQHNQSVLGFESNGGIILGTEFHLHERSISALPTRDGILPVLLLLAEMKHNKIKLSKLITTHITSYAYSAHIKNCLLDMTESFMVYLKRDNRLQQNILDFFKIKAAIKSIDQSDGMAITFDNGDIIYLRQSGNAPELRCYTESNSVDAAKLLNQHCITKIKRWLKKFAASAISNALIVPVILTGGIGKRLWPLSRSNYPKQFLKLYNAKSLLQNTVMRCDKLSFLSSPIIIGNTDDRFIISSQLADIHSDAECIILEPSHLNTSASVAITALFIAQYFGDVIMLVMPSDHKINHNEVLSRSIQFAIPAALNDKVIVFGVEPTKAHTGYGYIEVADKTQTGVHSVSAFIEKPDQATADKIYADGKHYWNSGIYMFKVSRILRDYETYQPEMLAVCRQAIQEASEKFGFIQLPKAIYSQCQSISFDHAITEKIKDICVMPLTADWHDLGGWQSLYDVNKKDEQGNVIDGNVVTLHTLNSYLRTEDKLVAVLGMKDCYIIETKDAILIADKNHLAEMSELTTLLKEHHRSELDESPLVYRPWGYYLSIDLSVNYQIKKLVIYPNQSISLQTHQYRSEHWIIIKGKAKVTLGNQIQMLQPNESLFVPVGIKHRITNEETTNLEIIEIQTGNYLGEDDIVRFHDIYEREKK